MRPSNPIFDANSPFESALPPELYGGFIGRNQELAEIQSAFDSGKRGIAITGNAGIGKTSLAWFFADSESDRFPGGISRHTAFSPEEVEHFFARSDNDLKPDLTSLLIIDEAHALGSDGLARIGQVLEANPNLFVILTSRIRPDSNSGFHIIELDRLSRSDFEQLMMIRHAIMRDELDEGLVDQFFHITHGNPAIATVALEAVRRGVVDSWSELFDHLKAFQTPGLLGADGRPINKNDQGFQRIITDVSSTNAEIMAVLQKNPDMAWQLPSRKFEEIVADILDKQGYDVTLTPASGDGGFDVFAARKEGLGQFLYLVECKRYVPPNKVGVEVVRSLYGVLEAKNATAGAIVTTSFFTAGAEKFQRELQHRLQLHDYLGLQKWIKSSWERGS